MADDNSPEVKAAAKRYQQALDKYGTIHQQTNDPKQHKAAEDEVHASLDAIAAARRGESSSTKKTAPSGPKSAWEMLTGK
jgi:hypothetical protein